MPWMLQWPRSARMPPPGRPGFPKQGLHDAGGANDLHASGVVGPSDGIAKGAGALAAGILRQRINDLEKSFLRAARDPFDHVGRVARVMALHDLVNAIGMLKRQILRRRVLCPTALFFRRMTPSC